MIEQKRILATSIPGPASQALQARKTAAVAAGVSTGLPVYVTEGAGGIVRDADGNQLIDFGSGIAPPSPTPASWSRPTTSTCRSARSSTS